MKQEMIKNRIVSSDAPLRQVGDSRPHEAPVNEQEEAERSRKQQERQRRPEFDHEPEYHERDGGLCDGKPCKRVRNPAERE